jgi:hypothetical protein
VKDAFDWSETVSEEVGELADEPQVVAVEFCDWELVEMMAEQAKVMEKRTKLDSLIYRSQSRKRLSLQGISSILGQIPQVWSQDSKERRRGQKLR